MDGEARDSLALLLKRQRLRAGLTQEALAAAAGLSADAISLLERGWRRRPQRQTIERLAGALRLSPSELAALQSSAQPPGSSRGGDRPATGRGSLPMPPTELIG